MTVNRRRAIKQFLFVSAGITVLPACLQHEKEKSSVLLKNFQLTGQQEKTMEELAETILPATATPGAKAVYAHLFVLKMLDDCYKKEDQQLFLKGLAQFEKNTQDKYGQPFHKCNQAQRTEIVAGLNGKKNIDPQLVSFYEITKKLTIQGYSSSKFYLTNVQVYKMIPGRYKGCVPV